VAATEESPGLRILSLCSGSGMLDEAVAAVVPGSRVVCFGERHAYAAAVLLARMEEEALEAAPLWCGDFQQVDWSAWAGVVDCITAGFPCQPFSAAGKQRGLEDERWLWDDISQVISDVRPLLVLLENVDGLRKRGLREVLKALTALGYDTEWSTLRASDVGAPHCRRRVFILAYAHGRRQEVLGKFASSGTLGDYPNRCDGAGRFVADPCRVGRQQAASFGARSEGGDAGGGSVQNHIPTGAIEDVGRVGRSFHDSGDEGAKLNAAYGHGKRREGFDMSGRVRPEVSRSRAYGGRMFPPGPKDVEEWNLLLREAPALEPAVCGMVDGLADVLEQQSEQLHLTGNGVVPLQAAVAFYCLASRAILDE
jgi:DNA (cytosine-5)-methyltransferase 1